MLTPSPLLGIHAEWTRDPHGAWTIRIGWRSTGPIHPDEVRVWPLWRPWEAPLAIPLPPGTGDAAQVSPARASLPPGHYLVELVADATPTPAPLWRPPMRASSVTLLHLGEESEQDAHLASLQDGGLRCVERYLASLHRDGRCDLTTLYPLRESLHGEDIAALLRMRMTLATLSVDERLPITELEEFTRQFLLEPRNIEWLCMALAHEAHGADRRTREALLEQCVSLDLAVSDRWREWHELVHSAVRHELWDLWAPLGAILATTDSTQWTDGLGRQGLERLAAWNPSRGALMGTAQDPELPLDAGQLATLQRLLGIPEHPRHPLDEAAYASGCFAWMRRTAATGPDPVLDWLKGATPSLHAWLENAAHKRLLLRAHLHELDRRWPPPLHSPLSQVPWCVGALALLCRARARTRSLRIRLHLNERDLRPHLMAAHRIAPELLAHDLCLAEALLRSRDPQPSP